MAETTNYPRHLFIGLAAGSVMGALAYAFLVPSPGHDLAATADDQNGDADAPLYWVAPMDPNFKRDKPGKSPMGMDLVPVYADDVAGDSPGTVSIDPVTVQNLGVKTIEVTRKQASGSLRSVGQVQFAQDAVEHVHPRVEGWVEVLNVRAVGDYVEKGEALYSLYSPELVNAQEEFVIALRQKNQSLIEAAQMRLNALAVPGELIDQLKEKREVSHTVTFLAPQSGYINELNVQQGFYVKPSMTMLSIASLDRVWVIADVFPQDATALTPGQPATIVSDNLPGHTFSAQLDYIYPTLNTTTRTVQARYVVEHDNIAFPKMLKPGMYAEVQKSIKSEQAIVTVPRLAVIRTGTSNRVVLAKGEGKYKSVNVALGQTFGDEIEITDGVFEGDRIVTSAHFLIDSESSISSDFSRMSPQQDTAPDNVSAWTHATVNEVMPERGMINITHGPLDAFDMMGMSMNFTLADDLSPSDFDVGMNIHVEVIREESGMFQIKTVHFADEKEHKDEISAWTHATVNEVDYEGRKVNLTHGYLDAFDMMGMTMDFTVSESINMDKFVVGAQVHVEIIREVSGMFQVKTLHVMDDMQGGHE